MTGYDFDYIFDWTIIKYQQSQKNRAQSRSSVSVCFALSVFKQFNVFYAVMSFSSAGNMAFNYFNDCNNTECVTASSWGKQHSCNAHACGRSSSRLDLSFNFFYVE